MHARCFTRTERGEEKILVDFILKGKRIRDGWLKFKIRIENENKMKML